MLYRLTKHIKGGCDMTVYNIGYAEMRDDVEMVMDGNRILGYDPESIKANPDHNRAVLIHIYEEGAPQEFLDGNETKFKNEQLGIYIGAERRGNYTHFRVCLDSEFSRGYTFITEGEDYIPLSYDIVKSIQGKNPELADITDIAIGFVV